MLFALDQFTKERIRAKPGIQAVCPGCQKEVIPRCGDFKIWHWAHKAGLCKYDSEPYTPWHLEWQERALNARMEIEKIFDPSQRYRADIYDPKRNIVTEVQHSPITTETIIDRCLFYDFKDIKIRWIFDFIDRYNSGKIELCETYYINRNLDYGETYGPPIRFEQKYQPRYIHCLFDKSGFPKYDINFNIGIDYDEHTNTILNVVQMSPDGSGRGRLYSSMIIEEQLIIPSYILEHSEKDFSGAPGDLLSKYKFEKIDNNKYIRKNEMICNIEESITIIEKIDHYSIRIKYKGYKESSFLKHLRSEI